MTARNRQLEALPHRRHVLLDRIVHRLRHIESHVTRRLQVLPRISNNRAEELLQESLLRAVLRHLLVLLQHEIGRAGEDEVVLELGEVDSLRRLEEHRHVRSGINRLNHLLVGGAHIHIRINADIRDAIGHRSEAAATPSSAEVQDAVLGLEAAIQALGLAGSELVNRSVVELEYAVALLEEFVLRQLAGTSLLDFRNLLVQIRYKVLIVHRLIEGNMALRLRLDTVLQEEIVEAGEACPCVFPDGLAWQVLEILVTFYGLLFGNCSESLGNLHL